MNPVFYAQTILSGAAAGGIYALVAIGFGVAYRTTRVFNFAQGDFGAIGAYVAFTIWQTMGLPFPIALLGACLTAGLIGVLFERLVARQIYRLGEVFLFISTLGLSFAIRGGIQQIWGPIPMSMPSVFGDDVVLVGPLRVVPQVAGTLVVSLLLAGSIYLLFTRTNLGLAMRSCAQDRRVSGLLGIHVDRMFAGSFFLSGAIGAIAGVLIAPVSGLSPTMGISLAMPGFIAVVVGGMGSMPGAVVAGLLLGILQSLAVFVVDPRYRDLVVYATFVLVVLIRPKGIFGEEPQAREV